MAHAVDTSLSLRVLQRRRMAVAQSRPKPGAYNKPGEMDEDSLT